MTRARRSQPRDLAGVYVYQRRGRRSTSWIVEYRDSTGRRHRSAFAAQAEAERAADERRRQAPGAELGLNITAAAYAERWLEFTRPPAVKPATWRVYECLWRVHWLPVIGALPVRRIDSRTVTAVLLEKRRRGVSSGSVKLILATLTRMLLSAVEEGIIATVPTRGLQRKLKLPQGRPPAPMTAAQLEHFRSGVTRSVPDLALLFRVLERTGLRHGEALGLRWEDVDWTDAAISVRRTLSDRRSLPSGLPRDDDASPKSGRSRTVRIPTSLLEDLRALRLAAQRRDLAAGLGRRTDWIFATAPGGRPPEQARVRDAFRRALLACGLPTTFRVHDLRHTYAVRLLEAGVDVRFVSRQLGHHSPSFTIDAYGRWLPGQHERDLVDGVFDGPRRRAAVVGMAAPEPAGGFPTRFPANPLPDLPGALISSGIDAGSRLTALTHT